MKTIYDRITQECPENYVGNHYSDLYIKANDKTAAIIREQQEQGEILTPSTFRDGSQLCYDIPFAYSPYWDKVAKKCINRP